ncbi:MAG TPA: hypothetical protein VFX45_12165 [Solirubrobacterales bacterium]|nr:hypothetical protein [Solirubrobacterales bacterium]
MMGPRGLAGLCLLCAIVASACMAQSAVAATSGTTAFTCKEVGEPNGGFSDAHCKSPKSGGKYKHVEIQENTQTELSISSETTSGESEIAVLKATIAGIALQLQATSAQASGTVENKLDPSGEHYVHADSVTTYTGVKVATPAEKGCKVYTDKGGEKGEEGVIHTNQLTTTTKGQGDAGVLSPKEGNVVATFIVDGCPAPFTGLNRTYTINGSIKCSPEGATIKCVHANVTASGTLTLNGSVKAGVEVNTTVKSKDPLIAGDTLKPLSQTTVETP